MEIQKTETFFSNMNVIIDKHMPVRKISVKKCQQKIKPWITSAIVANINTTRQVYNGPRVVKFVSAKGKKILVKMIFE